MAFTLSLSTNPFVNRFAEPEDLVDVLAGEIGIGQIQLTHEFINPSWPAPLRAAADRPHGAGCAARQLKVTSMMTGPYGRLNHFGHPDAEVRAYYVDWFKTLADIAADLGCPAVGTQYAILTYQRFRRRRAPRGDDGRGAGLLARGGRARQARGLAFLFWEPMSVARELGHTQAETQPAAGRD